MAKEKVLLYKRYERFWHWTQVVLIFGLLCTGFEIHGTLNIIGFEQAVWWHGLLAWMFLVLTVFTFFWDITTGEWRQYIPTSKHLAEMIRYYFVGIFKDEPHPMKKTQLSKLNPLQRLTYLKLKILIFPVQFITGFLYYYYKPLSAKGIVLSLSTIAVIHTIAAFGILVFVIVHIYLTTTGHTVFSNLKAMITGWEVLELEKEKSVEN